MSAETTTEIITSDKSERGVEYTPLGSRDPIKLSVQLVRKFLAPKTKSGAEPGDVDCMKFVMLCKVRGLDPWQGDAFLQGYDGKDGPQFSLITAHQAFLKRAEVNDKFDGMVSGVVVKDSDGKIEEYEGDLVLDGHTLIGGWARVLIQGRKLPIYKRLKLSTFNTGMSRWGKDPAGMIVKCAEADALRTAFPTSLGGMYMSEETQPVIDVTPAEKPRFRSPKAVRDELAPAKTETAVEPVPEPAPVATEPTRTTPITSAYPLPWSKLQAILDEEKASFDTLCEVCRGVPAWSAFTENCVTLDEVQKFNVATLLKSESMLRQNLSEVLAEKAGGAA